MLLPILESDSPTYGENVDLPQKNTQFSWIYTILLGLCLPGSELAQGFTDLPIQDFRTPIAFDEGVNGLFNLVHDQTTELENVHPFTTQSQAAFSLMGAFANKSKSFEALVVDLIRQQALPSTIGIRTKQHAEGLSLTYQIAGQDVCRYQSLARLLPNLGPVILGQAPRGTLHWQGNPADGFDPAKISEVLESSLPQKHKRIGQPKRCIFIRNSQLIPALEIGATVNEQPYTFWISQSEILDSQTIGFGVDGTSRVYATSPVDNSFIQVSLKSLKGDGTLTSTYFTTDPIGEDRATSSTHEFIYTPDDPKFAETSVFSHASLMLSFFKDLGYSWKSNQAIILRLHDTPSNTVNNAEYLPGAASADGIPRIRIGDGDGSTLQNLPLDSEVVSHEFGHHVVFDYLKTTKGPSLTVHEAYADFFTLAHNDDPCLAESVCPKDALAFPDGACWTAGKCLRTADNTLKLTDDSVSTDGHRRGQVVSGLLWDLREYYSVPKDDVTTLAFTSIKYFPETITFTSLIVALLSADREMLDSKYSCAILAAAHDRGFDDYISTLTCSGSLYSRNGKEIPYSDRLVNVSNGKDSPGPEKKIVCSTIGEQTTAHPELVTLFLIVTPLLYAGFSRRVRASKKNEI